MHLTIRRVRWCVIVGYVTRSPPSVDGVMSSLEEGAKPHGLSLMLIFGSCNRFWITVIPIHSLVAFLY